MNSSSRLQEVGHPAVLACVVVFVLFLGLSPGSRAQQVTPVPPPPSAPAASISNEELLKEIRALRAEVAEARKLKEQMGQLRSELTGLRRASLPAQSSTASPSQSPSMPALPAIQPGQSGGGPNRSWPTIDEMPSPSNGGMMGGQPGQSGGELNRMRSGATMSGSPSQGNGAVPNSVYEGGAPTNELSRSRSGATLPNEPSPTSDVFPLTGSYRYNFGTGALGGGGYFHIGDPDDEFTLNLTNQITIDGTFFDRQNMPTIEQGFNVPFARTFLYGNITKNWLYQIGTQGFLGQFNLLDMWMAYRFSDKLTIRFGKGLTPPLYEYYGFSPAMEPVVTNSPLFQMAGKRQLGIMFMGNLFQNRLQYWSGVTNSGTSFWYALNRNMEYNGAFTLTPFKPSKNPLLEGMGVGIGVSAGDEHYSLQQNNISFLNGAGEPTTNGAWVTSSGVPFAVYNPNVVANGMRTRWAPHFFWFGRFSILAEMMDYSRVLSDGTKTAQSTQIGYYVNLSYWLTGERDYAGNGFQGYSTIVPNYPFDPKHHKYGIGAWQVAAQFSELNVGRGDFQNGFINPTQYTNRLDQLMVGINCWPNKYTRLSFDWVWTGFNNAIPVNGPDPISTFQTFWTRFAMFF